MNKTRLIQVILDQLNKDLDIVLQSAQAAHAGATHEENKAGNKYDTRGLESAYLAEAQSKRAAQIQEMILYFTQMKPQNFNSDSVINLTAYVQVSSDDKTSSFFLAHKGGGLSVTFENESILVLGGQSPLAEHLLGRKQGEVFEVRSKNGIKEYEILLVE